jgi:hypothetical protein
MHMPWTRRQFLAGVGAAAAVIHSFDHLDPCCVFAADSKTADKDLFEFKPVADGKCRTKNILTSIAQIQKLLCCGPLTY